MRSRNQRSWEMTTAQPGKRLEAALERPERVDVEVVGGLVEQEHVAAGAQQLGQVDAVALASGELADLLLLVGAVEVERRDVLPAVDLLAAHEQEVLPAGDLLVDGLRRVERVAALVDVGELHRRADRDRARVDRLLSREHPEQRRLAGAVGADDADDAGRRQCERQVVDEQAVAEALRQVLDLDDLVAEALAGGDGDLEPVARTLGRLRLGEQLLVGGEAGLALGLAGLRRHAHPVELALERLARARTPASAPGEGAPASARANGVVALEGKPAAVVELEDPLGDVVEEVAVVGDRHDGAGVGLQRALEPVDRLGVEVVGGLVEKEQVGLGQQQPAQRDPAPLATGQVGHVGIARREAKRVHRDVDLRSRSLAPFAAISASMSRLLLADLLVVRVGVGVLGEAGVVGLEEPGHGGDAVHDVALHVLGLVEVRLLLEDADAEAGGEACLARVAVVDAGHDPQQRRLAGAVRADDADLGARVEGERDVLQDLAVRRVEPADLVHGVDELRLRHGWPRYPALSSTHLACSIQPTLL